MTPLLITTFCLGCCVGMIYTFAVYRYAEHRHKDKSKPLPDDQGTT